jgi:O-acetyl-ADP-ribose deacetylase (regulator of RNase III)
MITYTTGNLLAAGTDALVNAVNTVGIMGKGIALQFRETFPENYLAYRAACKTGALTIGRVLVTEINRAHGLRYIINFPTKEHWKNPSQLGYIRLGLIALKAAIVEYQILSVAIPALGCGNGGLNWKEVRSLMEQALGDLDTEIMVYEPI